MTLQGFRTNKCLNLRAQPQKNRTQMKDANEPVVHRQKNFSNVNYAEKRLENREFIKCSFVNCDFTKSNLSGNDFEDCNFEQCNFSMAIVLNTGFRNAVFSNCKLLGFDFASCNKFLFSFSFSDCILDYATFFGAKLKKTKFINCSLKEVDFSESDLSFAVFSNCEMAGARFLNVNLEKADFRTARNFIIDPQVNKVKYAKFSAQNLEGLLLAYHLDIE